MRNIFAVLACIILLAPVQKSQGADIDINDYFQIPADVIEHFPLLHRSQDMQQSTLAFAHVTKDSNSWTTHSTLRSIQIPTVSTNISFSYQNPETGTVTHIQNAYSTVADVVYLEHLHSVEHVICDRNSILTIIFDASLSPSSPGLRFGLKRSHYTEYTTVAGGQSFFCDSSCSMGPEISRKVVQIISHVEDPETGFLSSITIQTSAAPQESLYNAVADIFLNGTFALIPKTSLRLNRKSGRLNWHRYVKQVHDLREKFISLQSQAKLRAADCSGDLCTEFGSVGAGYTGEIRFTKSTSRSTQSILYKLIHLSAIDLFKFNYDSTSGKASQQLLKFYESSDKNAIFGCESCYAYAGVSFKFR
jgi:hypothetical protein